MSDKEIAEKELNKLEQEIEDILGEPPMEEDNSYEWVVTTKCVTQDAKAMKQYRAEQQENDRLGLDKEVEKPEKTSKMYQFHIREVESLVEYEDEDFGTITVINKYTGNQVPILEDFGVLADVHRKYNKHADEVFDGREHQ